MGKYWYQKNLRFLQTVLREIDIIDYDAKTVVEYMKTVNANCLVVNAGGVIDFFDNPLEMANRNRFYKKEILHDICDEIHKAGMNVITRVDFRGVEPRRYGLHPDWFALDQNGKPKIGDMHNVKIAAPCYNSHYANVHAENFVNYLLSNYELDGIWQNALGFDHSPCYCKNCRDDFRSKTGGEIPRIPDGMDMMTALDSPAFKEYRAWKEFHADRHMEKMRTAIKKFGDDKIYCAEVFDIYNTSFSKATGIDHMNAKKSFDYIVSCVFINSFFGGLHSNPYDLIHNGATTIRYSRALDPAMQPVIVTGGNGTRWRMIADPLLEDRLWQWEIASVGGGLWNCYFNGMCPAKTVDRRAAYNEKPIYTYLADNSDSISDTVPVKDVAIYFSNPTKDRLSSRDETKDGYGVYIKGIERVLLENHIQYNFIPDSEFTTESLKNVKTLLLPNAAYMPSKDVEIIREYVKNGGGLIASHDASLNDENGVQRENFGLADVFGVRNTGIVMETYNDSYQLVGNRNSPLLKGLGDTDVLMNGGTTLLCAKADPSYDVAATYIPTIHNQPPEYGWVHNMSTEYPTMISGEYGKGKAVYFANGIEAQCYVNGHEDYTEIYKNAIDYATGGQYTLKAEAPRSVHINAIEDQNNADHLIISFINTTGTSQRPVKEVIPVHNVKAFVPLHNKQLASSKVLYGGDAAAAAASATAAVAVAVENGAVAITIGTLDEFASVELTLA
ncbi:MAG: ThuA domain-containing protein [Oscillospiraceae bacterium]|nr:ThuA domain-containing protein [Oscillospiraceae bacterium]